MTVTSRPTTLDETVLQLAETEFERGPESVSAIVEAMTRRLARPLDAVGQNVVRRHLEAVAREVLLRHGRIVEASGGDEDDAEAEPVVEGYAVLRRSYRVRRREGVFWVPLQELTDLERRTVVTGAGREEARLDAELAHWGAHRASAR